MMSVMSCNYCGDYVDTDREDFDFEQELCMKCKEKENETTPRTDRPDA